jgi:hypothetical protein
MPFNQSNALIAIRAVFVQVENLYIESVLSFSIINPYYTTYPLSYYLNFVNFN